MSRKEITEKYGFPYRVVYSATVNMTNEAEAPTRGRSAANAYIKVNAENQLVEVKEIEGAPVTFVNGEAMDVVYAEEALIEKSRNEWIKEQVEAGVSRGDIAKILNLSYGVIYGLTKEAEGTRTAHTVELEDGTVVSRTEYIRMRAAAGVSRGEIAKELDVPYSVVWQATKTEKTSQEKYEDIIKSLEAFADKIDDKDAFDSAVSVLKELIVKSAASEEVAEAEAAAKAEAAEQ
jgi:transposase